MHPDQLAALDREHELTRAHIEALPPSIRAAVEALRLWRSVGMGLRVIASTSHAEALEEYAAETRAYVFAGYFYDEITEEQKRDLYDYIRAQAAARRQVLAAEAEYLARPAL